MGVGITTSVTDVFTEISNPGENRKTIFTVLFPLPLASLLAGYLITLIYNLPVVPETSSSRSLIDKRRQRTEAVCLILPGKLLSYTSKFVR